MTREKLTQALYQLNTLLQKGDTQGAHDVVQRALGLKPGVIDDRRPSFHGFDLAFNVACRKHNVRAAYVIFRADDPANPRSVRVLTGGADSALGLLKPIIEAGKHIVAEKH